MMHRAPEKAATAALGVAPLQVTRCADGWDPRVSVTMPTRVRICMIPHVKTAINVRR
uniref:Uncharacterized protein n=1 Tax=Oryza sativa subsp. japonica TaxID=39947 RepID=Q5Z7S9_ORYSJ|nr:hypothetical protein [Oryza sativa Japonica Group]BAD54112.1 hypothetical protein [Oryza sativa Japonica Group]